MKKFLVVVFSVILFSGIAWAADIYIDVTNSRMEIVNSTTIRIHNINATATDLPSGVYWADFQWDAVNYLFVPVNYGEEPPTVNECPLILPSPPVGVEVPITDTIIYNGPYSPPNAQIYCINPGEVQYFKLTIPPGQTSSRGALASSSQNGHTKLLIAQASKVLTAADAATYISAATSGLSVHTYPPTVWGSYNDGDTSGEHLILTQSGSITTTTTTALPGNYYIIVKNMSANSVFYYLYWKTY